MNHLKSERNRKLLLELENDLWNRRREEVIGERFERDIVVHLEHGDVHGQEGSRRIYRELLQAFPDFKLSAEMTMAEGDEVVVMWLARATHSGNLMGIRGTGRKVEMRGTTWAHFKGDRIQEAWIAWGLSYYLRTLLEETLSEFDLLRGILPICSYCKKIRNEERSWEQMEEYIGEHSEVKFSHGICPDCVKDRLLRDMKNPKENNTKKTDCYEI